MIKIPGYSAGEQSWSAEILGNMLKNCCDIEIQRNVMRSPGQVEGFVIVLSPMENTKQIEKCAKKYLDLLLISINRYRYRGTICCCNIGYPCIRMMENETLWKTILADVNGKYSDKIVYSERLGKNIAENTLLTNKLYRSINKEFFWSFNLSLALMNHPGVEALLRWSSGITTEYRRRFVPILEQTGLIYDVGLWVLDASRTQ